MQQLLIFALIELVLRLVARSISFGFIVVADYGLLARSGEVFVRVHVYFSFVFF